MTSDKRRLSNREKDEESSGYYGELGLRAFCDGRASMRKEVAERLSDLTAEAGAVCPTYEGVMSLLDKLIEALEAP